MVRSLLALGGLAALAYAAPVEKRQVTCATDNGLYILVARGSNQPVGEGTVGPVANLVEARVAGSYSHAIDYPATIIALDSNYITSVVDGIEDTKASIEAYVAACGASSRIALIGYSQGGNVMTDTLAGGTGKPAPIAEQYRQNIVGVAVFGDPRFNAGQPYSRGTSTRDGIFARDSSLPALSSWSNVLVSYCDENDLYCASGLSLDVHLATVSKYAQEAADFIIGLAQ
ncbi:Putative cutinase/acetylxylan esterase, alpha/Beta hydrolase [Septoria linicola]|uniref:Cutinase/acetylxylan esterase, alpha/Beta hydrolase n=1 Tax=Septoria linicola TaxID=215465 RepID=A0A9Q9EGX8_9PEZI|nr:Putative cutinase/acetylxylan esterase, alpha/Beta hydrolase [Septoria linicola]